MTESECQSSALLKSSKKYTYEKILNILIKLKIISSSDSYSSNKT